MLNGNFIRACNAIGIGKPPIIEEVVNEGFSVNDFFLTPDQIVSLPRKTWLRKDYIKNGSMVLLYAKPNSCKSFIAMQIGLGIASGRNAWGMPMQQGAVFYLTGGEGVDGLRSRVEAWRDGEGGCDLRLPFFCVQREIDFLAPKSVSEFIKNAKGQLQETPHQARLVVVDTLARHFGGRDENTQGAMSSFVRACDQIRHALDCTVLVVHHVSRGQADSPRGASALDGAVDTMLHAYQSGSQVILEISKQKDGEKALQLQFEKRVMPLGVDADGYPITSLVLDLVGQGQAGPTGATPPKGSNQRLVYDALTAAGSGLTLDDLVAVLTPPNSPPSPVRRAIRDALPTLLGQGLISEKSGVFSAP